VIARDVRQSAHGGPCGRNWRAGDTDHGAEPQGSLLRIDPGGRLTYLQDMAKLDIVTLPDPILRKVSTPVERVDADLRRLIDDMLETMYAAPGIGLAGIQVGVAKRLLVIDAAGEDETPQPVAMINPEILERSDRLRMHEEGCLSIPDVRIEIDRPDAVRVRYLDRDGKLQELAADGLLATAIQHEIDHLDGKLIIDFLSKLKRDMVVRRFKKAAKTVA
jgi:peptide deformylase